MNKMYVQQKNDMVTETLRFRASSRERDRVLKTIVVEEEPQENKIVKFIKKSYNAVNEYFGLEDSVEDQVFFYGAFAIMWIVFTYTMASIL